MMRHPEKFGHDFRNLQLYVTSQKEAEEGRVAKEIATRDGDQMMLERL
jgi:hypothetical protein